MPGNLKPASLPSQLPYGAPSLCCNLLSHPTPRHMHSQPAFALRRINFVQAQRQDAHNVDLSGLIQLNDPESAAGAEVSGHGGAAACRKLSGSPGARFPNRHVCLQLQPYSPACATDCSACTLLLPVRQGRGPGPP